MHQGDKQTVSAPMRQVDSECIKKQYRQTLTASRRQADSKCIKKQERQTEISLGSKAQESDFIIIKKQDRRQ